MTNIVLFELIAAIGLIIFLIWAILKFDLHCEYKFGYRFIKNWGVLLAYLVIIGCLWGASYVQDSMKPAQATAKTTEVASKKGKKKNLIKKVEAQQIENKNFMDRELGEFTEHEKKYIANGLYAASALIFLGVGWYNIRKTNLLYGIGGTLLQAPILAAGAFMAMMAVVVVIALFAIALLSGKPRNDNNY